MADGEQLVARPVVRLVRASFFGEMCAYLCIVFFDIFGRFCVLDDPESTENGRGQKKTTKT